MSDAQLVGMARQITLNLAAEGDVEAVAHKAAEHLRKFWTPAMRQRLVRHCDATADELPPAVLRAAEILRQAESA
jgi:hypothetical protein